MLRIILALLFILPAISLRADDFPSRPVRLIYGFGPGSSGDVMSRIVGQRMSQELGQPFVVEGKPGANGQIAAAFVARAPKDGYTIYLATVSNVTNLAMSPGQAVDLSNELTPIALVANAPFILVVNPSLGVSTVKELIALAKAKPGELFYGSVGPGSPPHLFAELFCITAGVTLTHVPYTGGSGQAATDLIAGRISMIFSPISTIAPYIRSGHVKALGIATAKRVEAFPDLPTIAETGLSGFDSGVWSGLMAPAGTPSEVIGKLARATGQAVRSEEVLTVLNTQGLEPLGGTATEFAHVIETETRKWVTVAKTAGLSK